MARQDRFSFCGFGYGAGLLGSGFVSYFLTHRFTITLAGMMGGVSLILISRSQSIGAIHAGLVFIGFFAALPSLGDRQPHRAYQQKALGKAMAIHEWPRMRLYHRPAPR